MENFRIALKHRPLYLAKKKIGHRCEGLLPCKAKTSLLS